ncbi:MAG: endolytic transglycosylase MltG [Rhodoferax sp.]|nr:endolytic transglycosylase MltG [Rhodoferax sp.]
MIPAFIQTKSRAVRFLIAVVLAAALLAGIGLMWVLTPMEMRSDPVSVTIAPGTTSKEAAHDIAAAGVDVPAFALYVWFRLSGQSRNLRAGSYELTRDTTPWSLLQKLVRGDEALRTVTLVEGWTFQQVRQALARAKDLKPDTRNLSEQTLMQTLGRAGLHPEGRFFPDTYTYAKGSSDVEVLRRALQAMDAQLAAAWDKVVPGTPLHTPDQVLVLASIIEKETGRSADQPLIAAVFHNRLRIGMRLQTDPTVIYGMGERFDGNLRRADLLTDTPYNTYTRAGLPPTPISMPGRAALMAAVQPARSDALYFVGRGDGSSHFSETLDAHNKAVDTYQRGR